MAALPTPGTVVFHKHGRWGRGVVTDDRADCLPDQVTVAFDQGGPRRMYVSNLDVDATGALYSFTPAKPADMAHAHAAMVAGHKYELVTRIPRQRYFRRHVFLYVGLHPLGGTRWHADDGGSQYHFADANVVRITEVPADTPCCVDQRASILPVVKP